MQDDVEGNEYGEGDERGAETLLLGDGKRHGDVLPDLEAADARGLDRGWLVEQEQRRPEDDGQQTFRWRERG